MGLPDKEFVIRGMRDLVQNTILSSYPERDVRQEYAQLSDDSFSNRYKGHVLCQGIALMFRDWLSAHGYSSTYLFFYQDPLCIKKEGFNAVYLNMIRNRDFSDFDWAVSEYIEKKNRYDYHIRATHGMLQVYLGDNAYVVDPYCCLFYNCGKEDLLRNPQAVYDAGYYFMDQGMWLAENSIHRGRSNRISASPEFWRAVYHISKTDSGDLPKIKQ